jgi:hypothetical protein
MAKQGERELIFHRCGRGGQISSLGFSNRSAGRVLIGWSSPIAQAMMP